MDHRISVNLHSHLDHLGYVQNCAATRYQKETLNLTLCGYTLPVRVLSLCLFVECFFVSIYEELQGKPGKYYFHFVHQKTKVPEVTASTVEFTLQSALQIQN